MLHCCGGIRELLPSIAAAGIDAVHALQPDCRGMDPASLKQDFGHLLVLNGCIDSHGLLIDGSVEEVRAGTRAVLAAMAPGGGFIAGASHDYILPEAPVANVVAMFDEIQAWRNG
jgi:uroporphyrinogen decarboxylase